MRVSIPNVRSALTMGALLALSSCTSGDSVTGVSNPMSIACPVTMTQFSASTHVAPHSGGFASWFLKNSSASNITITGTSCVKTGNIATCTPNSFGAYVPANSQIDGDVNFTTGAAGTGTVALRVTLGAPCGSSVTGKAWTITIN
jgi:hypothetical protein